MKFLAVTLILIAMLGACAQPPTNSNKVTPSGVDKTETLVLSGFTGLQVANNIELEITVGPDFNVSVEGDGNIVDTLSTSLEDKTLILGLKQKFARGTRVKIKISMPALTELELAGASTAVVTGVKGESLKLTGNGATRMRVTGEVKALEAIANGGSTIEAEELKTSTAKVQALGVSGVIVSPSVSLNAITNGMSKVQYTGNPKVEKTTADTSSVVKKE